MAVLGPLKHPIKICLDGYKRRPGISSMYSWPAANLISSQTADYWINEVRISKNTEKNAFFALFSQKALFQSSSWLNINQRAFSTRTSTAPAAGLFRVCLTFEPILSTIIVGFPQNFGIFWVRQNFRYFRKFCFCTGTPVGCQYVILCRFYDTRLS